VVAQYRTSPLHYNMATLQIPVGTFAVPVRCKQQRRDLDFYEESAGYPVVRNTAKARAHMVFLSLSWLLLRKYGKPKQLASLYRRGRARVVAGTKVSCNSDEFRITYRQPVSINADIVFQASADCVALAL
jgi:hypothetical protein